MKQQLFSMKQKPPVKTTRGVIICSILAIILIVVAFFFVHPVFKKARTAANFNRATGSLRQVGVLLYLYEQDYGHFPNAILPDHPEIIRKFPQQNRDDSNYILGQLIRLGYTQSEAIFYARISGKTKKPDGEIDPDSEILSRGECSLTYLTFADRPLTSKDSGNLPILITPLDPNTNLADPKPFDQKVAYLRLDSSVQQNRINTKGEIVLRSWNEKNPETHLFQTGPGTPWGDKKPKFHHPLYLE